MSTTDFLNGFTDPLPSRHTRGSSHPDIIATEKKFLTRSYVVLSFPIDPKNELGKFTET